MKLKVSAEIYMHDALAVEFSLKEDHDNGRKSTAQIVVHKASDNFVFDEGIPYIVDYSEIGKDENGDSRYRMLFVPINDMVMERIDAKN